MNKTLALGTAQWGWTIDPKTAFQLFEHWLNAGENHFDTASNYPINQNPADFGAAAKILREAVQAHGLNNLHLTLKVGAIDNLRSPDNDLSPTRLLQLAEQYRELFGDNALTLMTHWDNRDDAAAIRGSFEGLLAAQQQFGIKIGFSGVKHPEIYATVNESYGFQPEIQCKHNLLHSDLPHYAPLFAQSNCQTFVYGINGGGIKLESGVPSPTLEARGGESEKIAALRQRLLEKLPEWNLAFVRPPLKNMNQIGLIYAEYQAEVSGILLGPSTSAQLLQTLDFCRNFEVFDYSDVYKSLQAQTSA
ncbi:MAG: aldo/keto reductase [Chitinophagales bacterium]|nr:aldo/keto reductase [Chitinophagales bacterium]